MAMFLPSSCFAAGGGEIILLFVPVPFLIGVFNFLKSRSIHSRLGQFIAATSALLYLAWVFLSFKGEPSVTIP